MGCGSVSPNSKNSSVSSNNNNSLKRKSVSPALIVSDYQRRSSSPGRVNFKPYEASGPEKKQSKSGSIVSLSPTTSPKMSSESRRKSPPRVTPPSTAAKSESTNPVVRSGMEVLAGHHHQSKDLQSYSRMDPTNPAFRPPFAGIPGYPPSTIAASLAAAAASAAAGGISVCRDPYCRDPTCPTAVYNAQLASMSSGLGSGYAELLKAHQMASAMAAAAASTSATSTTPSSSSSSSSSISSAKEAPYICNWMNGRDGYCGKRHTSAEDLLQHLRTHTNLSTNDAAAAAAAMLPPSLYPHAGMMGGSSGSSAQAAAAAAAAAAAMHRSYGSLAAAARYHPYAKPPASSLGASGALPPSLSGLGALGAAAPPPGLSGLGASALAGLAGAYSPLYALYGSRLNGSSSALP